jgi:uncharacterized membrane protein
MKKITKSIQSTIFIGGIMVTPIAVTLWILFLLIEFISSSDLTRWLISPFFKEKPEQNLTFLQTLLSLGMVLVILFLTGLVFKNILGRRIYQLMDMILERTPVINKIYTFVRAVSESILAQKETMFKEVVLVEYPHPGAQAVAFVSATVSQPIQSSCLNPDEPNVFVFIPTTPNPTSGVLLAVPKSKVTPLALTTTEAMRLIISAGATGPDLNKIVNPKDLSKSLFTDLRVKKVKMKNRPVARYANVNYPDDEA